MVDLKYLLAPVGILAVNDGTVKAVAVGCGALDVKLRNQHFTEETFDHEGDVSLDILQLLELGDDV